MKKVGGKNHYIGQFRVARGTNLHERTKPHKVYRSTRYVFIHCLWLKIESHVNLKPWIIDPAIYNTSLETLAKLDTFW